MSTGLSVISRSEFQALAPLSAELAEARQAMEDAGELITPRDLIRVKTPAGGVTTWDINGVPSKDVTGLLVCYQPRGVLWPSDKALPGTKPVLQTLQPQSPQAVAEQVGPIPDHMLATLEKHRIDERHFRWSDLPYNQWGSGKGGRGKLAKEQRELFILRKGDLYPVRIVAQPGSVGDISKFFKGLVDAAKVPYWRCVVELTLVSKQGPEGPYSVIVPKLVGTVDAETGAMIKRQYTDPLKEIVKTIDEEDAPDAEGE